MVGVSSIILIIESSLASGSGDYTLEGTAAASFSIDPITLAATFESGTAEVTTNTRTTTVGAGRMIQDSGSYTVAPFYDKMSLYVYNGNGEIIQTAVTPEEE